MTEERVSDEVLNSIIPDNDFRIDAVDLYQIVRELRILREQVVEEGRSRDAGIANAEDVAERRIAEMEEKLREVQGTASVPLDALDLAIMFHHTYERLAPNMGYDTRKKTRIFDPESANGKLMIAVCAELLPTLAIPRQPTGYEHVPMGPVGATYPTAHPVQQMDEAPRIEGRNGDCGDRGKAAKGEEMNTCKTCKHWTFDKEDWHVKQYCAPREDTGALMVMPFEVRECGHPAITFCERPVEINGFGTADGSTYMAALITAEEFGCVRWEENK